MSSKTIPDFWFETSPWIDGEWGSTGESVEVINPATQSAIASVLLADQATLERAIRGASDAFRIWRTTPAIERGNILIRCAQSMLERKDVLARLLTAEQGKPYLQSIAEVEYAASFFQWYGEQSRRIVGRIVPHPEPNREFHIEQRPIGVAGLITPWNFPLAQGAKKIAAALAAGCTAVWKPSELTPLIALAMGPIAQQSGVPAGVLQIVPAKGPLCGSVFAEHPAIRVLSLTGSTATGRTLMAAAASQIKRVSLELGGNAPFIVLPDANLEFVAEQLVRLKLFVSGQVCVTANRIFVHADAEAGLIDSIHQRMSNVRVGNGLDEGIDAGPLIHRKACDGVARLVGSAVDAGATKFEFMQCMAPEVGQSGGSFYPPTLLTEVRDPMELAQREIFGPVMALLRYDRVEDAVRRANETPYGLAAYVYGNQHSQCHAVARELDVGIIGINEWRPLKAEIPFGGVKQSGIGSEGGQEGLREFLDTRVISLAHPSLDPSQGTSHD